MIEAIPEAAGFTAAICSRDRPEMLRRALTSLMALDPPADEILVIDNAPSDDRTFTLIRDEFPAVRYVCEHVAGLDFARNRALAESRHSILGFI
ncbi:MAG: glycosyltransferase family 2 protein, partial [Sphingomonadaceae bacterium]